jgi:hypothetical protein
VARERRSGHAIEPGVADELGGEALGRQHRIVELDEPVLEREPAYVSECNLAVARRRCRAW